MAEESALTNPIASRGQPSEPVMGGKGDVARD